MRGHGEAKRPEDDLQEFAALDDPDLVLKREGGGFVRLDRIFEGELEAVNDALWESPAA